MSGNKAASHISEEDEEDDESEEEEEEDTKKKQGKRPSGKRRARKPGKGGPNLDLVREAGIGGAAYMNDYFSGAGGSSKLKSGSDSALNAKMALLMGAAGVT